MFFYFEPNLSKRKKMAKIEMTRNKNSYLAAILKRNILFPQSYDLL